MTVPKVDYGSRVLELTTPHFTGTDVLEVQLRLGGWGLTTPDGDFGSFTRDAVMAFQKAYGLNPTGKVGDETYKKLDEIAAELIPLDKVKCDCNSKPCTEKLCPCKYTDKNEIPCGDPHIRTKGKEVCSGKPCDVTGPDGYGFDRVVLWKMLALSKRVGGKKIIVHSGYRCSVYNACLALHGHDGGSGALGWFGEGKNKGKTAGVARHSNHKLGSAIDFHPEGMNSSEGWADKVRAEARKCKFLEIEPITKTWVHCSSKRSPEQVLNDGQNHYAKTDEESKWGPFGYRYKKSVEPEGNPQPSEIKMKTKSAKNESDNVKISEPQWSVLGVQKMLVALGYDCGEINGVVGQKTKAAIEKFQKDFGLAVDGIPGKKTKSKLQEAHKSSLSTTDVQWRLNALGYDCGEVTGVIDSKTRSAVEEFQKRYDLAADGIPGPETCQKLREVYTGFLKNKDSAGSPVRPEIKNAYWSTGIVYNGQMVKIHVMTLGVADGTSVSIGIFEDDPLFDNHVENIKGTVIANKCTLEYKAEHSGGFFEGNTSEVYFVVRIGNLERSSTNLSVRIEPAPNGEQKEVPKGTEDPTPASGSSQSEKVWPLPDIKKTVATSGGREFKASRGNRWHCGIDILAPVGTKVVATEDGKVVNFYGFTGPPKYKKTYCLFVQHASGYVVNYGEIQKAHVKKGDEVKSGQEIAEIGQVGLKGSSMLHFELYKKGTNRNYRWPKDDPQPDRLLDPEDYLKECVKK
jgi:peptidoglycan hydrolase-like protein with peptidoglycan-binding domain/murein DD-endopeptidase MepM/ murein hydrolase activator NlpD